VDEPTPAQLVCFPDGLPLDERLTRIDEELTPVREFSLESVSAQNRQKRAEELRTQLRNEVFRYFPSQAAEFRPIWSDLSNAQGRIVRKVNFHSFEDLRVRASYSLPANAQTVAKLPGVLVVDHRKGIPVWGNEQPWERNQWGNRAVLIVEVLDRGSRALEQNLRSFADDDLLHHMKRQAMIAGTTLESMQVYEILRSLEFLRSLPDVDSSRISIAGKGEMGINGLYAALMDGNVARVVLTSPTASHRQGPHYLGILKHTDIPEVFALMGDTLRLYGELAPELRSLAVKIGSEKSILVESLPDGLR
jgi:hypothetical protein